MLFLIVGTPPRVPMTEKGVLTGIKFLLPFPSSFHA